MPHRFITNDLERLCIECMVAQDAADLDRIAHLYRAVDDAEAFAFAEANELDAIVAARLADALDDVPAHWTEAHERLAGRIQAFMDELDRVAGLLAASDIPLVALKNCGIARAIYPHPGESPMGDLDVLVRRADFERAHAIIDGAGYEFDFRAEETIEEAGVEEGLMSGGCEYGITLDSGDKLYLELQWRPVAGRWIRPDVEPRADDLITRSVPAEGTAVRLLSPNDNLLQVCLHTAKHTYIRAPGMRLHTDVDRIVRHQPGIDWDAFVDTVRALELTTACWFSLAIPHALLRTPVPDAVLHALAPPVAKRELMLEWLHRAGFFYPDAKGKFSRAGYIAFVMLLFDDVRSISRGVFPEFRFMREAYGISHRAQLPLAWGRRIVDLTFRRVRT